MRPEDAVAEILGSDGRRVGLGFLAGGVVLTCAHVVNLALGRDRDSLDHPARAGIQIRFTRSGTPTTLAHVSTWGPRETWRPDRDLAALSPSGETPDDVVGLTIAAPSPEPDLPVNTFGFPDRALELTGESSPAIRGLHDEHRRPVRLATGYSGGPVWNRFTGEVVGMIHAPHDVGAECLDLTRMLMAIPARTGVTDVLHLQSPAHSGMAAEDMVEAITALVREQDAAPAALLVSGDLAANGRPREYAEARDLLQRLTTAFGLAPGRIFTVPGPGDVNDRSCQAYFLFCEATERELVPPYWPKWGPYHAYDPLPADAPWRFTVLPDPGLLIAGLNSTIGHTHLQQAEYFGHEQLDWFARRLIDHGTSGLRRIAFSAIHPSAAEDADVFTELFDGEFDVLLGGGPPGFGLLRFEGERLRTWRSDYLGRRERAESVDLPPRVSRPPAPAMATPTRIDDVLTALRIREPNAMLRTDAEGGYVHVTTRADFGDGLVPVGEYVIGVEEGVPTVESVARFTREVVRRFDQPGGSIRAQLVHFGPLPDIETMSHARHNAVSVMSFRQFQFGWDPRPFTRWQRARLDEDPRYPAQLYVPQRYREIASDGSFFDAEPMQGLHRRILSWLSEDAARLIVVLGGAGAGKTFLLRTLARQLADDDSPVTPVYLQLRDLERVQSLNEYVAARFAAAQEHRISMDRFNYYLDQGHIALLLDGLDELTARSTYDRALGHLETIREVLRGRAKIVVTARDTEFLSNGDVLRVLGGSTAALLGRRAVRLEAFTDDQIMEVLARLLGSREAALRRLALLRGLGSLPHVARNPRMLSFIASIPEDRLLEATEASGGQINAAELYRAVLGTWMDRERDRLHRPGERAAMSSEELWTAVTNLAVHMGATGHDSVSPEELGRAGGLLSHIDSDARAHQLGSGSLLVRHENGELGFIHRSIQEWLVAKATVEDPALLARHRLSPQAARFYTELGGRPAATTLSWTPATLPRGVDMPPSPRPRDLTVHFRPYTRPVCGAVDPSSRFLATGDEQGRVQVWDLRTGEPFSGRQVAAGPVRAIVWSDGVPVPAGRVGERASAISPDGTLIASGDSTGRIAVSRADGGEGVWSALPHERPVTALVWSPDGRLILSADTDGLVSEIRYPQRQLPRQRWTGAPVLDLGWSPDGTVHFTIAEGGEIIVRAAGKQRRVWSRHERSPLPPRILGWSADGTELFTLGHFKAETRRWSLREHTGEVIPFDEATPAGPEHPDGSRVASTGPDGLIRVRTREGEHVVTFIALEDCGAAAVLGDGRTFKLDGILRGEFWYTAGDLRLDPLDAARTTVEVTRL